MKSVPYIVFLRGINVGGNHLVKMADLKKLLEGLGYAKVKTLLASGNVTLEAGKADPVKLAAKLAGELRKAFGFEIPVLVRSRKELVALAKTEPFALVKVTPETRLYVTFLSEKPTATSRGEYTSDDGSFSILKVTDSEVCGVLDLSKGSGTVDAMVILEKRYGKNVTTRNWNTVQKLLAMETAEAD
ncbi:MAG TPA: DUF1697 domain-containing protein [Candidatus Limnocylindria bacterium]|nr:DUF1697 domain-containing protein [Candidatus Limnocylindria bacterium]